MVWERDRRLVGACRASARYKGTAGIACRVGGLRLGKAIYISPLIRDATSFILGAGGGTGVDREFSGQISPREDNSPGKAMMAAIHRHIPLYYFASAGNRISNTTSIPPAMAVSAGRVVSEWC